MINRIKVVQGVGILLVGMGFGLLLPIVDIWLQQNAVVAVANTATQSRQEATSVQQTASKTVISGVPTRIRIPSMSIDLLVRSGGYNSRTGQWDIDNTAAFYAALSRPINSEGGNTLIYGHDSRAIFGQLKYKGVAANTIVIITTDSGYDFTYEYVGTESVKPTDVTQFAYDGEPRLTLQTCTGLWDQLRALFYFRLIEYKHL